MIPKIVSVSTHQQRVPDRFLQAANDDHDEALRRYNQSLKFRRVNNLDSIIFEPSPHFRHLKQHYPHYFHFTGRKGEPCFYEKPAKTNLRALRRAGVTMEDMFRHCMMVSEYLWNHLYPEDDKLQSIYIVDLQGIRMTDFASEAIELLKRVAEFCAAHHPCRTSQVFVINVPRWFQLIWSVVKTVGDPDTLSKTTVLRSNKDEILLALQEYIAPENIPEEYGGSSVPLGRAPQELEFSRLMTGNERTNLSSNQ